MPGGGRVRDERLDLGRAELARVSLAVKQDKAPDPSDVRLLGTDRVIVEAQPAVQTAFGRSG